MCYSAEIMIVSLCFPLLDITLIIRYMLWGMCCMLAERQIVVPLWRLVLCLYKKKKKKKGSSQLGFLCSSFHRRHISLLGYSCRTRGAIENIYGSAKREEAVCQAQEMWVLVRSVLGYVVNNGLAIDPAKVKTVVEWERPTVAPQILTRKI